MKWERATEKLIRDISESGEPVVIARYAGACIRRTIARWSEKKQGWFWGRDCIEWNPDFVLRFEKLPSQESHNATPEQHETATLAQNSTEMDENDA